MSEQKVIHGDCLEVMKSFADNSFDLVLTDPPYGMAYQSSRRTEKYDKIENDVDIAWFQPFAKELYRVMKDDTHVYIFCNDYAISDFRRWLEEAGFTPKLTLVWVKNNHTSGDLEGDYGNKTEFVIYAQKGRRLLNGKRETNVLMFDRVASELHPTQKPVELCSFLISKSSAEGETVFDPFSGSGTTLIAAKNLGRNAIGIEINQEYQLLSDQRLGTQPVPMF